MRFIRRGNPAGADARGLDNVHDLFNRDQMRRAISILVAVAAGLAVVFVVPALLLMRSADPFGVDASPFVVLLDVINAAPIWMPLAPIAAAFAYYRCYAKLSARNDDVTDAFPGWKVFRMTIAIYLVMVAAGAGSTVWYSYQLNYVCGPDDNIIQSEVDAIKQAQRRIFKAHYGTHDIPGYVDEEPSVANFGRPVCCEVKRTLTRTGVILWEVSLDGETIGEPKKRHVSAVMRLSNCGVVFDDSYMFAKPIR